MAAINDLINQVQDQELRARLQAEVNKLSKQKKFGLVYEEHMPECTALYDAPIRVGSKVALKDKQITAIYEVKGLSDSKAQCYDKVTQCEIELPLEDLICIAEFGEPIYPYLEPVDSVCNAPDSSLWHALIEADNYHALQLLEYLYAGQVDCIYIDPPYNTGARDWKYNNDYVDSSDAYRHSKWLSMMEKRLRLAKKLLNPRSGVLMVTIDEHEVHHLRCLMEEIYSDFYIQMVTCVTNPTGASQGRYSRIEEYITACFAPDANVTSSGDPMIGENIESNEVRWKSLLRSGTSARREDRKNMFYPVYVDPQKGIVVGTGEPLEYEIEPSFEKVNGYEVAWPIRSDYSMGRWSVGASTLDRLIAKGYVQLGRFDKKRNTFGITYISSETEKMIEDGTIQITRRNQETGVVSISFTNGKNQAIRTVWYRKRHNAGVYGTNLLGTIFNNTRSFPFPKSVYVVKDTIASVVRKNPSALVLDFFSGSGTTLHAVNLLNAEDGGQRRCIMVTNNEVSDEESKRLKKDGFKPGDPEWESLGIAQYVTWPRTVCSIEGHDVSGNPLKGNYLDSERPMADGFEANAAFFKLGFLDKNAVALGRQFKELLPVLWMKTGCVGTCPRLNSDELPSMLVLPENGFAILLNELIFPEFIDKVNAEDAVEHIFIVTDSIGGFKEMASHLQAENVYQMYRDYLDNFRINIGR
ncbi:site-specific DNA-methyltransferase [Canibacter sp. lx-72]|uniref:site-specific DNA-methyltransferase n=1 Tax=Canibacter zhuwentaonis TaxID=2837491 RepID=UPI001BDC99C5|nr:site-specific DNA-methyltransferase [Canibacter zhuwentaonis]MBT1018014.1 site-specific DNA-methyltransferase [Canibacter zhuwentaonis]